MANIHIKHTHQLKRDEARTLVEEIAKDLQGKLNAEYAWKGDSLHFQRSGASGCIDVGDDFVECKIKLGMLLSPMKEKIQASIEKKMHKILIRNGKRKLI